ncbi:MAG: hypothetical protein EOO73_22005 [Myxococcales bacterium]|nr:MAG: hypothetical protein EOO73_22005 [Myxococcales bacterium]
MRAVGWLLAVCAPAWLSCSSARICEVGQGCGGSASAQGGQEAEAGAPSAPAGGGGAESSGPEGGEAPRGGSESDAGASPEAMAGAAVGGTETGEGGGACDAEPRAVGALQGEPLTEISGIVASVKNPGVYYVHNDSGDTARFFAIDEQGRTLAEISLTGATAIDWEDIALGPGPGGESFVYLGDVGDNNARVGATPRPSIDVYRVAEPLILSDEEVPEPLAVSDWSRLPLSYPGPAHDCEALLLDPESADLVLVTKENDGRSSVFRASGLVADGVKQTLELVAEAEFGTTQAPGSSLVTGGELSPSGDALLLRTYTSVFFWSRPAGSALAALFSAAPQQLPAPAEEQGEAITFSADGLSYLTVSEQEHADIFRARLSCEL